MAKPKHVQDAIFAGSTAKLSDYGKHGARVATHKRRAKAAAKPTAEEQASARLRRKHAFKEEAIASWGKSRD